MLRLLSSKSRSPAVIGNLSNRSGRDSLLLVENLSIRMGPIRAVSSVNLELSRGEILGIVGESGAGKSMTARSILGLLPSHAEVQGSIRFMGTEIVGAPHRILRTIRGGQIGFVFQDGLGFLDPVRTVGAQLIEALRAAVPETSRLVARRRAVDMLAEVKLSRPERVMESYPHQLSGGMRQRVGIAIALIANPSVVVADEPTSALDVTVQRRILDMLVDICEKRNSAVLLITHDLGVVAQTCDRVAVMYGGLVVEQADVFTLFDTPSHPYTRALLRALPRIGTYQAPDPIDGQATQIVGELNECPFVARCDRHTAKCVDGIPDVVFLNDDHAVRCIRPGDWNEPTA